MKLTDTALHDNNASRLSEGTNTRVLRAHQGHPIEAEDTARMMKRFYVVEGSYEFYAEGRWLDVGAGDTVLIPYGWVHGFRSGPNGGRALLTYPGRQERCFVMLSAPRITGYV